MGALEIIEAILYVLCVITILLVTFRLLDKQKNNENVK